MHDYQAMLLKGAITLALLQGTWALTSPLKRLRRAATVTKGANVGLASLKPADLKIAGSAACGSYIQGYTTGVLGGALLFLGPHFGLTPAQIGAVATATTLGSVLGTFSASALADAAGRRPTMAFSSALFVVASVLMVWTSAEINQCIRPAWRYYLLFWQPRRSTRVLGVLARGVLGLLTRTFDFRTGSCTSCDFYRITLTYE